MCALEGCDDSGKSGSRSLLKGTSRAWVSPAPEGQRDDGLLAATEEVAVQACYSHCDTILFGIAAERASAADTHRE
jgi:hypothetical protein